MNCFDMRRRRIAASVIIGCVFALAFTSNANGQKYRYFGTNLTDWAVLAFPPAGGQIRWRVLKNENPSQPPGTLFDIPFGQTATDNVPNQGNWIGDGAHDLALHRDNTGTPANTYIITDPNGGGATTYFQWGLAQTDFIGAEGDYDGDGKMDYTVVRAPLASSPFQWWILRSSDSTVQVFTYGGNASNTIPLAGADYTGDGVDDPAIARIATNGQLTWFWANTSGVQLGQVIWGNFNTDFIVPAGDYDGDGKADFMVWRGFGASADGVWYLLTNSGSVSYFRLGMPGGAGVFDLALRSGDYDGDGKTDIALYRSSNMTFYVNRSSGGGIQTQVWGAPASTNLPVANFGVF